MNGRMQVESMVKLMNSEQKAPAESAWPKNRLAGWTVGDHADVETLGRVQVVELRPPSELLVRIASGATCLVKPSALRKVAR